MVKACLSSPQLEPMILAAPQKKQSNALDVSHGPVAAVARLFPRELLTRHTPKYSLIAHTTTTMANTSVATANTFSKEATLISVSASSPTGRLGDSLIRMQSRRRGRVHVIFGLCSKSHSSVPDQALHGSSDGLRSHPLLLPSTVVAMSCRDWRAMRASRHRVRRFRSEASWDRGASRLPAEASRCERGPAGIRFSTH
jgi:hypothetical protein